jgi:hypothetical protein
VARDRYSFGQVNLDALRTIAVGVEVDLPGPVAEHTRLLMETMGVVVRTAREHPGVTAIAAHDLTAVRVCKRPNCDGDATRSAKFGPYAGLCDDCVEAARRQRSAQARGQAGGSGVAMLRPTRAPATGSLSELAKGLPGASKRLEKAAARHAQAKANLDRRKIQVDRDAEARKAKLEQGIVRDRAALADAVREFHELLEKLNRQAAGLLRA